uniref:Retrovirus-related Pol polyprotein from transposon TNT 1-94 n=2 Tax=Cajanus cajan TaxID=3821 RepID=A0A151UAM9_CAJCA|nr:Retrovirus-related Pol polyprotein from transposon TNT 1-94 [Cajanus cajan]
MAQPPGFTNGDKNMVCKLQKSLYGLKQAPRAWFQKLHDTLSVLGFNSAKSDCSLFFRITTSNIILILVYVDDLIISGSSQTEIDSVVTHLQTRFPVRDLGFPNYFLGIQVTQMSNNSLLLTQTKYINDLLKRANMVTAKPVKTPMTASLKLTNSDKDPCENPSLYSSIVGSLQYLTITRPEISFSVNKVCQFMQELKATHWQAVKRILRYLCGTATTGIVLTKSNNLHISAFCDADWGADVDDRKSTTGFCVFLGCNPVSWSSRKQQAVSRSTTEAEYRSLAAVTAEITWLKNLLHELRVPNIRTPKIYCDNLSAVLLAANPILHSKTKHFELDLYFVRDKVQKREISVQHIPSLEQTADIFTKPLTYPSFSSCMYKLRLHFCSPISLRGSVKAI